MSHPIGYYVKLPYRYANIDGLQEIGGGLFFLFQSCIWCIQSKTSAGSIWRAGYFRAFLSFLFIGLLFYLVIPVLKKRITYPKTGFVKYPGVSSRLWLVTILSGLAGAALIGFPTYFLLRHKPQWLTLAGGLMMAFLYLLGSYCSGGMGYLWRRIIFVFLILSSLLISMQPLTDDVAVTFLSALLGCALLISGTLTLVIYLRLASSFREEAE